MATYRTEMLWKRGWYSIMMEIFWIFDTKAGATVLKYVLHNHNMVDCI